MCLQKNIFFAEPAGTFRAQISAVSGQALYPDDFSQAHSFILNNNNTGALTHESESSSCPKKKPFFQTLSRSRLS
jgi:hypothetical protein